MNHWDIRVIAGSYSTEEGKVVIDLFGRTRIGESLTARIRDFLPYFYLVEPSDQILEELKNDPEVLNLTNLELEVEGEKRRSTKVTIQYPFKVPEYRNKYKNNFIVLAADIPFIHRFYYDFNLPSCIRVHGHVVGSKTDHETDSESVVTEEVPEPTEPLDSDNSKPPAAGQAEPLPVDKKYSTDLIVEVKKIQPINPFKPKLKILSFDIENSIKDSTIFCICTASRDTTGEIQYREFSGDESTMILEFIDYIRVYDPDVITGYNIDNFDIPVLLDRAGKNNILPLQVGRDGGKFNKVGTARFWRVHGRVIADAWWNAKMELRPQKETLNFLSKMLFNETKADVDPSKIDEEWAKDQEKVKKYCTRDAELALRILEKIAVIDKAMDLATVAKFPLDDALNSGTSTLIDSILIREADKNAIGVPCTKHISKAGKIEGGYVHSIRSGLYNYVSVLDFRSMYPSIIISNNICFTTLNSAGSIKSPTGIRFLDAEQRKGLLPKILEELMEDREAIKKKMKSASDPEEVKYYDGLQAAIKILMNSVYGVFASSFYRFTDQKIGASITAYARKNIKDIITKLENEKISVIYSDTDSIFVETGCQDLNSAIEFGKSLATRFTKGGRVLEFEGVFEPFFSHGKKKRYVGRKVFPTDELVIRGYETQRTDAFNLQKDVLMHIFELILSGKKDELVKYARETVNNIKRGEIPLEKLVISKSVKAENQYKDPDKMANVIAMRQLKKLGYEVVPGMKVSYIVTNGHKVPQEVEPHIEDREFNKEPDWDYYTERVALTISRITDGIIPEYELDYQGLVSGSQQKSIFSEDFAKLEPEPASEDNEEEDEGEDQAIDEEEEELEEVFEPDEEGTIADQEMKTPPDTTPSSAPEPEQAVKAKTKKKKGKKGKAKATPKTKLEDFM
ncbi:DNA-directed DNA polymerase [[Eubacterium] cellulosolvens]